MAESWRNARLNNVYRDYPFSLAWLTQTQHIG
jgi:hypothetical protein